jgi:hypothetical protein
MGALVVFTKDWAGILVVPLVTTPVIPAGCTLVHEMLTFELGEVILMALLFVPEQMVWFMPENCIIGDGLTVMV